MATLYNTQTGPTPPQWIDENNVWTGPPLSPNRRAIGWGGGQVGSAGNYGNPGNTGRGSPIGFGGGGGIFPGLLSDIRGKMGDISLDPDNFMRLASLGTSKYNQGREAAKRRLLNMGLDRNSSLFSERVAAEVDRPQSQILGQGMLQATMAEPEFELSKLKALIPGLGAAASYDTQLRQQNLENMWAESNREDYLNMMDEYFGGLPGNMAGSGYGGGGSGYGTGVGYKPSQVTKTLPSYLQGFG